MRVAAKCYICYNLSMGRTITQRELRNDSAAVLREVQGGQTIVVARRGVPVAELRPVPPRRFVPRAAIAESIERAPHVDPDLFRSDVDDQLDQSIDG